jgi:N-acetylglucosaminyl-diphospho-decaprenol L-rhamnosyltransferase
VNTSLSVVVVSYNTRDLLRRCLRAVAAAGSYETLVVDNASSDGTAEALRTEFPDVRVSVLPRNLGFGTAANAGIRSTAGAWILLLNADAWPAEGGVASLLDCARGQPKAALLGPQIVDVGGLHQRSVIRHPSGSLSLAIATALPELASGAYSLWHRLTSPAAPTSHIRPHEFLMGAALLVRRQAFEEVGGFDESFFMFNEEVDLSLRFRHAGWSVGFCPGAVFVHAGGASTTTVRDQMELERLRSHLRFMAKHEGSREAERGRRLLVHALRLRRRRADAEWLAMTPLDDLLRPDR